ncbi:MAG: polysulfide reductase NrfD [Planctomycetes bacterium]|nr:polysulfide reductase NrfD [Planctomycetota bacterium]
MMRGYLRFLGRSFVLSFAGGGRYQAWMFALTAAALVGVNAGARQWTAGLATTGLSDHVTWGIYIAGFALAVGTACAAVLLVLPLYFLRGQDLLDLALLGAALAVACVLAAAGFVIADTGRPDRVLHILVELPWHVLALGVFLLLNLHVWGSLVYCAYLGRRPGRALLLPFALLAVLWAFGAQSAASFLYVGLGGRAFWETPLGALRFAAAACAAAPAVLLLTLLASGMLCAAGEAGARALRLLRALLVAALCADLLLCAVALLLEFLGRAAPRPSMTYLYFGLDGRFVLAPWIWTALALKLLAVSLFWLSAWSRRKVLAFACGAGLAGVLVEEAVGRITPAFVPSPLGEVVEYAPTLNEALVCLGVLAVGLLSYSVLVRITAAVSAGRLTSAPPFDSCEKTGGPS